MINGIYHVKYTVGNSLDKLKRIALIKINGLSWYTAFTMSNTLSETALIKTKGFSPWTAFVMSNTVSETAFGHDKRHLQCQIHCQKQDKNQRLVAINGIYHVKYSVGNSLDKLKLFQSHTRTHIYRISPTRLLLAINNSAEWCDEEWGKTALYWFDTYR